MKEYRLAEAEARFADLIWANEPIGSTELVKLCEKELGWKKSRWVMRSRKSTDERRITPWTS